MLNYFNQFPCHLLSNAINFHSFPIKYCRPNSLNYQIKNPVLYYQISFSILSLLILNILFLSLSARFISKFKFFFLLKLIFLSPHLPAIKKISTSNLLNSFFANINKNNFQCNEYFRNLISYR